MQFLKTAEHLPCAGAIADAADLREQNRQSHCLLGARSIIHEPALYNITLGCTHGEKEVEREGD